MTWTSAVDPSASISIVSAPVTATFGPTTTLPAPAMAKHPLALQIGKHRRIRARPVILVADAGQHDLAARQVAADRRRLAAVGREGVVGEAGGAQHDRAAAQIVLEAARAHRRDARGRHEAGPVIVDEVGAGHAEVARAVVEDQAGDAILADATAHPLERAHLAAAGAVGETGAALGVVVHPRIEHGALRDIAQDVEPDAADMLDVDVADRPVVERAIGAVGHDLDAVALLPVAQDREVGQRQPGQNPRRGRR